MKILVDADGCPVVEIVCRCARKYGVPVLLICDTSHEFFRQEGENVSVLTVSKGADSADFALVNRVCEGDIVVTQDYGLAAMCLAKKAIALNQDGMLYGEENMDSLLLFRHQSRKLRNSGRTRLKGPKKRMREQDERFGQALEKLVRNEDDKQTVAKG